MNETRQLAEFIVGTDYDKLPQDVVELAKFLTLDNIASAFIGSSTPWYQMVADLVWEMGGKEECTIIAHDWRATPSHAALLNGISVGGSEIEHGYSDSSSHPSAAVFPAALAAGEKEHISGKQFITALVLGYETTCRIGEAATRAVEDVRGFHGPGTNGPFGAAAATAKALGLDLNQTLNALGIAGSHAAGLNEFTVDGAMTKCLHLGRAAQNGLESALLAQKGFTGPSTVLEGKHGFFNVYSPSPTVNKLLEELGKTYKMKKGGVKSYACHGTHQAIIEELIQFKEQHPIDAKEIKRVEVVGSQRMMEGHDNPEPTTIIGAQYNLPFSMAVALLYDISNPLVFNERTLWDGEVRTLAKKIKTAADNTRFGQSPGDRRAEITLEIGAQKYTLMATDFKGSASNPFTLSDMDDKVHRYLANFISPGDAEEIITQVHRLEEVEDISQLAKLLGRKG